MARTVASLPAGSRITDYISLGVLSSAIPRDRIDAVLTATGKKSLRQRDLPAYVVVYYVVALALFMQSSYREVLRCLLEGLDWLRGPAETIHIAGKSGISQARTRLGSEPLRLLLQEIATPVGLKRTRGAWYRTWRLTRLSQLSRQGQAQFIEQDLNVGVGLGIARQNQPPTIYGGQMNVDHLNGRQLFQYRRRG